MPKDKSKSKVDKNKDKSKKAKKHRRNPAYDMELNNAFVASLLAAAIGEIVLKPIIKGGLDNLDELNTSKKSG